MIRVCGRIDTFLNREYKRFGVHGAKFVIKLSCFIFRKVGTKNPKALPRLKDLHILLILIEVLPRAIFGAVILVAVGRLFVPILGLLHKLYIEILMDVGGEDGVPVQLLAQHVNEFQVRILKVQVADVVGYIKIVVRLLNNGVLRPLKEYLINQLREEDAHEAKCNEGANAAERRLPNHLAF